MHYIRHLPSKENKNSKIIFTGKRLKIYNVSLQRIFSIRCVCVFQSICCYIFGGWFMLLIMLLLRRVQGQETVTNWTYFILVISWSFSIIIPDITMMKTSGHPLWSINPKLFTTICETVSWGEVMKMIIMEVDIRKERLY